MKKVMFAMAALLMSAFMFSCTGNGNKTNEEAVPADTTVVEDSAVVDTLIADTAVTEVVAE